jgi:hypothetical protein
VNSVVVSLIVVCIAGVVFMLFFLFALARDKKGMIGDAAPHANAGNRGPYSTSEVIPSGENTEPRRSSGAGRYVAVIAISLCAASSHSQSTPAVEPALVAAAAAQFFPGA